VKGAPEKKHPLRLTVRVEPKAVITAMQLTQCLDFVYLHFDGNRLLRTRHALRRRETKIPFRKSEQRGHSRWFRSVENVWLSNPVKVFNTQLADQAPKFAAEINKCVFSLVVNPRPALFNRCARCTKICVGCTTMKGFTKGVSQTCHTKQILFTKTFR